MSKTSYCSVPIIMSTKLGLLVLFLVVFVQCAKAPPPPPPPAVWNYGTTENYDRIRRQAQTPSWDEMITNNYDRARRYANYDRYRRQAHYDRARRYARTRYIWNDINVDSGIGEEP
ncbi:uncharacterized protein [Antedon mediterranea]|uniref:uncharacterized protein isoform X2 n=1 Tax=Antedon mediterranea TaxID=105859 RepID=UPI003AF7A35C